jgi:hypothetical protein
MVHADSSRPAAQQTLHSHGPPRVHASACAVARATPPACPLGGWGLGIVHHGGKQLRTPVLLQCGELIVRVVRNNKEGVKVASGLAQASVSWRVRGPVPGRPPGRDRRCPGGCTTGRTLCVSLALNTCCAHTSWCNSTCAPCGNCQSRDQNASSFPAHCTPTAVKWLCTFA